MDAKPAPDFGQAYWRAEPAGIAELPEIDPHRIGEAEFRLLADNLPTLCWIANGDGYIVWYNRRWYDYTGATPEQMEGWGWRSVHDPAALPEVEARWAESIATGLPFEMTFPLRGADGVLRPFLTRIQPLRDSSGRVARWFGVNSDVTGQIAAEEALRGERDRYRSVLDGMDEGFALLDRDFRFVEMNRSGLGLDPRPPEEILGRILWEAYPGLEGTPLEETYRRVMQDRTSAAEELLYTWPDGRKTWFELRIYPVAPGIAIFYRDVTERRQMEERVRADEGRMRMALAAGHLGDWTWDTATDAVDLSEQAHAIFGTDPGQALTWDRLRALLHPEDAPVAKAATDKAIADGADYHIEYRVRRPDGAMIWVAVHGRPVFNADGACTGMIGVARDVTARHRAEEQRKLLIDELNHRVKNTLAIVQGVAQQTFRSDAAIDQARQDFEGRLMALATAHSLLTRENWRSADLRTVLSDTVRAHDRRAERFALDGPPVRLAPQSAVALAMAAHELCTNAVKYGALGAETGRVEVCWRRDPETGRLRITWSERGGPPVVPPTRRGFGSRMIERALAEEMGGVVMLHFESEGLVCEIDVDPPAESAP